MKEIIKKILSEKNLDAIIITDPYNLRYYSGFRGGEGVAVITTESSALITDSRYTEAAGKESDFEVLEYNSKNPMKELIKNIIKKDKVQKIGFEDLSISYDDFRKHSKTFDEYSTEINVQVEMLPLGDALLIPRRIKSEKEIGYLREAEHIGDMAFEDILNILRPGMTELEVAAELEYSMKKHGAEGFSFDTIAASGVNSSMPHAIPSDKKLENGDFLTMDFGCIFKGYCSDMTRTVCIGKAGDEQKKIYDIVLTAQKKVLEELKPGMMCKDVDRIARDYISEKGYGIYFGHGLGHGVGLYIHESPAFNTRDESIVKPGMVETDEPGIYLPGRFGVRIEDMILITEDGCESLAKSPKNLIEL